MFTCDNCGSTLRFDPKTQMLVCENCGASVSPQEYSRKEAIHAEERNLSEEERAYYQNPEAEAASDDGYEPIFHTKGEQKEKKASDSWQAVLMTCPQCGGQLLTADDTAATFCSFCGASVLLESRVSKEKKPDLIIPFQKTKEDCAEAYRGMLKRAVFVPRDMKSDAQIERFRGIYMPYWIYSFSEEGEVVTTGEQTMQRGDTLITNHLRLRSKVKASFDGISYDASSSFSDNLSGAIAPFHYDDRKNFEAGYLSGFYADTADVDSSLYEGEAYREASKYTAQKIAQTPEYAAYHANVGELQNSVRLNKEKPKLAMYPVWFLASRNRAGDRVSYAVVNGETGEIAADLPVDKKKLLIGTLILAVPIFLILNLLFTLKPAQALAITIILGLIGIVLANRKMNQIYRFENHLDDRGYQSGQQDSSGGGGKKKKTEKEKAPFRDKIGILWKPVAGIIAAIAVMIVNPVSDTAYYTIAIISMALVAWSFWDTLGLHNRLASRPLPQFEKRGGEEFENR